MLTVTEFGGAATRYGSVWETEQHRQQRQQTRSQPARAVKDGYENPIVRVPRHRRYVHPYAFALLRAVLRYSATRDAYVLRVIGRRFGPVLRVDRRAAQMPFDGQDRRHAGPGQAAS